MASSTKRAEDFVTSPLFEVTAESFAANTDAQIASDTYRRGELFLEAARKWIPSNGRVLDYGCGPGRIAHILAVGGYRVVGVDPSPAMIREANRQGPVAQLEFENCFDVTMLHGRQ